MMAVLDPVKLVIDNYPEGSDRISGCCRTTWKMKLWATEKFRLAENCTSREKISWKNLQRNTSVCYPGNEVRLMNAYFVTCVGYETDENGNVTVVHCTYDPATKGGRFAGRKKSKRNHSLGKRHRMHVQAEVRLYENIIDEEKGVYNEDGSLNLNPNSLTVSEKLLCGAEP